MPVGGAVLIQDFCRGTGLDESTVAELMRTGRLHGGLWQDAARTVPYGILEDGLPTRAALTAMGLDVSAGYDPEALRSFELGDD